MNVTFNIVFFSSQRNDLEYRFNRRCVLCMCFKGAITFGLGTHKAKRQVKGIEPDESFMRKSHNRFE